MAPDPSGSIGIKALWWKDADNLSRHGSAETDSQPARSRLLPSIKRIQSSLSANTNRPAPAATAMYCLPSSS